MSSAAPADVLGREARRNWTLAPAAAIGWIVLASMGGMLLARRLGGYLSQPLPAPGLIGFGLFLGGCSVGVAWLAGARGVAAGRFLKLGAALAWLPAAVAVSLPNTSAWALGLFWLLLLAVPAAVWAWDRRLQRRTAAVGSAAGEHTTAELEAPEREATPGQATSLAAADAPPSLPAGVLQQWTRRQVEEAVDLLEGGVRIIFEPGERTQVAHVAFCPPFPGTPETEIEIVEGSDSATFSQQVYSYGLRIEVRRKEATKQESLVLWVTAAWAPAAQSPTPEPPDCR